MTDEPKKIICEKCGGDTSGHFSPECKCESEVIQSKENVSEEVKSDTQPSPEVPQVSGDNVIRDENGKFVNGHEKLGGRKKGSVSITTKIKQELEKIPAGQKISYLEAFISLILRKAMVEEDSNMIRLIWNYIDGMPKQQFGLDDDFVNEVKIEIKRNQEKNDSGNTINESIPK